MQETQEIRVCALAQEDPLEKEMATHSSILAWRIPWTEEPGGLQSMGLQSWTRLKQLSTYHFSRFYMYALIYDICFSLSDLLHSVWQTLGSSMFLQMVQFHFFLWLSNIPLCIYVPPLFYPFLCWLKFQILNGLQKTPWHCLLLWHSLLHGTSFLHSSHTISLSVPQTSMPHLASGSLHKFCPCPHSLLLFHSANSCSSFKAQLQGHLLREASLTLQNRLG